MYYLYYRLLQHWDHYHYIIICFQLSSCSPPIENWDGQYWAHSEPAEVKTCPTHIGVFLWAINTLLCFSVWFQNYNLVRGEIYGIYCNALECNNGTNIGLSDREMDCGPRLMSPDQTARPANYLISRSTTRSAPIISFKDLRITGV